MKQLTLLTASILVMLFSSVVFAQGKLYVGFSRDDSLRSMALNSEWHSKEMAKILQPLIYDQLWLVGPAPDYLPEPGIAEYWETEDNKTWRFYLDRGSMFSDGIPVTARDVMYSVSLLKTLDKNWQKRDWDISSFIILDNYAFEITLSESHSGPYPPLSYLPVLPRHIWKAVKGNPAEFENSRAIGSGAYRLSGFNPGEGLILKRNPYFRGGEPLFEEISFVIFENSRSLYLGLRDRIIDMMGATQIPPRLMDVFDPAAGFQTTVSPGNRLIWLSFNLAKSTLLQDNQLRKAIMYSLDKAEIAEKVYSGYADELNSFVFPELSGYNPDMTQYRHDPDKASEILDDAGYRDPDGDGVRNIPGTMQDLEYSLMVNAADKDLVKIAGIISEQTKKIGLKLNLMSVDAFIFDSLINKAVDGAFDIAIDSMTRGPAGHEIWQVMNSEGDRVNPFNTSNYSNDAFNRLMHKMLTTPDLRRKERYLNLMQEILADELPYGLIIRPKVIDTVRQSANLSPTAGLGGIVTWFNPWIFIRTKPEEPELDWFSNSGMTIDY